MCGDYLSQLSAAMCSDSQPVEQSLRLFGVSLITDYSQDIFRGLGCNCLTIQFTITEGELKKLGRPVLTQKQKAIYAKLPPAAKKLAFSKGTKDSGLEAMCRKLLIACQQHRTELRLDIEGDLQMEEKEFKAIRPFLGTYSTWTGYGNNPTTNVEVKLTLLMSDFDKTTTGVIADIFSEL